jgi:hypothetical protein
VDLEKKKYISGCEEDFIDIVSLICNIEICGKIFGATFVKVGSHNKKNFLMGYFPFGSRNYQ